MNGGIISLENSDPVNTLLFSIRTTIMIIQTQTINKQKMRNDQKLIDNLIFVIPDGYNCYHFPTILKSAIVE